MPLNRYFLINNDGMDELDGFYTIRRKCAYWMVTYLALLAISIFLIKNAKESGLL